MNSENARLLENIFDVGSDLLRILWCTSVGMAVVLTTTKTDMPSTNKHHPNAASFELRD